MSEFFEISCFVLRRGNLNGSTLFLFYFLVFATRKQCSTEQVLSNLSWYTQRFFSFLYISVGLYTNGTYFTIFLCRTVLNKFHNVVGIVIVIDV